MTFFGNIREEELKLKVGEMFFFRPRLLGTRYDKRRA